MVALALGTGMTQAGILCAQLDEPDAPEVLGFSIARDEAAARAHVQAYADAYQQDKDDARRVEAERIRICDRFRAGYGRYDADVADTLRTAMARWGLPLDGTYTGKAFHGLMTLCREEGWQGRRVLFIHTGGTPLFFDAQNKEASR